MTPASRKKGRKRAAKEIDEALFRATPFALPNHLWITADWIHKVKIKPEEIILRFDMAALVRKSNRAGILTEEAKERIKPGPNRIAIEAEHLIDALLILANKDDQAAASSLVELLQRSVSRLTELVKNKPELLRRPARKSLKWPVMKSRHPLLSDNHEAILAELNLGYDLPFYFDNQSKWQFDEFGKIAASLLLRVWRARKENRGLFDYGLVGRYADALPEFRRGPDADKWWKLARAVLLTSYPKPEEISEFSDLVTLRRRTRSRVREKILERIRQRFINFAKP
jgi:hypothetical protein